MTALTTKQRVQLNAALSIIHHQGFDVTALQRSAASLEASGRTRLQAYEAAFATLTNANPSLEPTLKHMITLIGASDSNTVARYDAALKAYNNTGDEGHLNALEPMVRRDSVALAIRSGQVSADDAHAGRVDWNALGMDTPAGQTEKFSFKPASAPAPATTAAKVTEARHNAPAPFTNQFSFSTSPTGVRVGKSAEHAKRAETAREISRSPFAGKAPDQIREAFRAAHVNVPKASPWATATAVE